jgi:hypothetical protein
VKSWSLYLIVSALVLQGTAEWWIKAAFERNQNYIVSEWCVQRDAVVNTCLGQCVLMKKLQEHQEQEKEQVWASTIWNVHTKGEILLPKPSLYLNLQQKIHFPVSENSTLSGALQSLFKPPLV